MNKFLFLDMDGVANSQRFFESQYEKLGKHWQECPTEEGRMIRMIDPVAMVHLNAIAARSECRIVISSTWRQNHTVGSISRSLRASGFEHADSIMGKTGYRFDGDSSNRRGLEIMDWIAKNTVGGIKFVILDDSADMGPVMPHLVRTTWQDGLMACHVKPALSILEAE